MTAPAEYTEETAAPSETTAPSETVKALEIDTADTADTAVTSEEGGVLILGGTPIGNLADASDRLRSALATADLIAVEDTRKLRTLASGLGVRTRGRVIVNHDHNEEERSATIVQAVQEGQRVLLLSDAACPPSRPGYVPRSRCGSRPARHGGARPLRCVDRARALRSAHRTIHFRRLPRPQGLRAHPPSCIVGGGGAHHDFLRIPAPHCRNPGGLCANLRRRPPWNCQP